MTVTVAIADSEIDPESPGTTTVFTKLRNNPISQGEGDSTAPAVQRNIKHIIATRTASASATIDFSDVMDGTYKKYVVELINVIPSVNGSIMLSPLETGGSTWRTGNVYTTTAAINTALAIAINVQNTTAHGGVSGYLEIHDPSSSSVNATVHNYLSHISSATGLMVIDSLAAAMYEATTAVTGIRFVMNSGTIASGEFRLYGISA